MSEGARVLLTGAGGQLGRELIQGKPEGIELAAATRAELDLTDLDSLAPKLRRLRPDVILNTAAYTAVDRAESDAEVAYKVNGQAVGRMAECAAELGSRFVHLSTDFVFDGTASAPYRPEDAANPASVYGRSKLAGESTALEALPEATVVRTSWLYSARGRNFVTNMLRLMAERDSLQVVADQVGSPTWAAPLAEALWRIVARSDMAGVWHWCDGGRSSWYDFACAIQEEALTRGLLARRAPIEPVPTAKFPTPARRPAFSALDDSAIHEALGSEPLPWREALGRMLDEMARERSTDG